MAEIEIPPGIGEKMERLAEIMAVLRSPQGCPWDLEQTPARLTRHLLEEAYESVEAIEHEDWNHLREELGDLLLQIVFQSQIAREHGRFDLAQVIEGISEKLERRHPHIFGEVEVDNAEQVSINWEKIKREEEGKEGSMESPTGLPALLAAMKIQGQAARVGFDWTSGDDVFNKLEEETTELWEARGGPLEDVECEVGDLLFTVVNISRHLGVDPEMALRGTCREFVRRYRVMEEKAAEQGRELEDLSPEALESLWEKAKEDSKNRGQR